MAIQNKKSEQTSKLFALFHLGPNRTLRLRALLAKLAIELGHTDQELLHRHYRELVKPEQAEKYWNIRPGDTNELGRHQRMNLLGRWMRMVYFFRGQAPKTNLETQVDPVVMSEERKQQEIAIPVNQPPAAIPILPEEKSLYFNGFGIAVGGGDIIFTLMRNGVPTLTLNASFTVAKTFGESMVECIRQFEAATNHKIMTVQEVVNFQAKANAPSESS